MKIRQTGTHRKGMNAITNEALLRAAAGSVRFYLQRHYRPLPMPKRPFDNCPICKGKEGR